MIGKPLMRCGFALLAWVFLILIQCTMLLDFYYVVGLMGAVFLMLFIGGLIALAMGIKNGRWNLTGVFAAGMVFLLLTIPAAQAITSALKQAGIRDAAPVIVAAAQFRESQSRYPVDIEELVPKWLEKVPEPAMLGTAPYQFATHYDGFFLFFDLPDWQRCTYSSATCKWVVHD